MRENDTEFSVTLEAMWREAFEAKKAAIAAFRPVTSTEKEKIDYIVATAREQALYEAFQKVSSIALARCDRELAEGRQ